MMQQRAEEKEKRRVQTPLEANLGSFFVPSLRLSSAINASKALTTEAGRDGERNDARDSWKALLCFKLRSNCAEKILRGERFA